MAELHPDLKPLPKGFPTDFKIDAVSIRNLLHERNELAKRVEKLEAAANKALAHMTVCDDREEHSAELGADAIQALTEALKK